ncbi:hypothetical protein Val02_44570 [Virgisporangium aliadipatigenens]|uniref:DUF1800 domain-containing protein n=1 Tax=Virgisporangium aliadipatigenens TaxID=741659 RepID=A0A8J3YPJ3_9ACTN|nr:DUF1800 domain-containing protein [Virgisporangium aliadipatigenens]GIJ47571.1 hypothetical protein Val02_44570 [Virgisporangium aliadipatigenens]
MADRRAVMMRALRQQKAPRWLGAGRPALHRLIRSRRQALMTFGSSAVVLAGLSSTAAVMLGGEHDDERGPEGTSGANQTPREAGSYSNRDASYTQGVGGDGDLGAGGLADTPTAAAQAALGFEPKFSTPLTRDPVLHLLRRTTFGVTPQDVADVRQLGIDAWLDRQLDPEKLPDPGGDQVAALYPRLGLDIKQLRGSVPDNKRNEVQMELGQATIGRQAWSSRQLYEVMVDFWNNHLNIQNPLEGGADSRPDYDRTVIRKHAFGKFSDMLLASARHPAMMRYLDNAASDRRAVNENYGRELLELHTVGIDGGYGESDVRNAAYVLTGRTISRDGEFVYDPKRHYSGAVTVMGWSHPNKNQSEGLAVGDTMVRYLALHPSTAKYVARKLAVRFVCDSPPAPLVDRLAQTYLDNGSAVVPMLRVLFRSLEFWIATGLKTRRPLENLVATARVLGVTPGGDTDKALETLYATADRLGHAPLAWAPPDGYPDVAGAWQSAHGMLGAWNVHRALVSGKVKGATYAAPEQLVAGNKTGTAAGYLDALSQRLVFQPLTQPQKDALLQFLGMPGDARVSDPKLGGKLDSLAPLLLDSVYHGLR